jgi:membrane-associated protease RseP (regulator of RpoE activity)
MHPCMQESLPSHSLGLILHALPHIFPPSPCLPPPCRTPAAEALSHTQVYVSPLLVGGWCGLITTALNCLPVGNLDGGRTMLVSS